MLIPVVADLFLLLSSQEKKFVQDFCQKQGRMRKKAAILDCDMTKTSPSL